jgi:uncharacterized membrane protein YeaQ/YmgE (transglycosylase-associated protein family)
MQDEEAKKPEKLTHIATIIVSLAGILVTVIFVHSIFPRFLFYSIVIAFAGAILCLLIYQFIYPPVLRIIRNIKYRRKQNILVLKYSKKFRALVKDFYDCARSDRSHSLKNLIEGIIQLQQEEINKVALKDLEEPISLLNVANISMHMSHNLLDGNKNISLIHNPLTRFIEYDHKNFRNQKTSFILEVDYFQYILSVYESMIKDFTDVCRTIKQTDLLEGVRKEYLSFASDLDYFFKKYSDFGKKANQEFGEQIFREYFDLPKAV